jgi:hypothetical protein
MATADALINLGTPAEVAKRIGWQRVALVTSGAVQGAGAVMKGTGNQLVTLTVTSASDAATLPNEAEIGDEVIVTNPGANAGVIYPPSGETINGNAADAQVTLAAAGSAGCNWRFMRVGATTWTGRSGADAT